MTRNGSRAGTESAPPDSASAAVADTDPDEAAWRTAVEAAPWLIGEPGETVPPEELYGKLKPFEEKVAEDIEQSKRNRE